MKISRYKISDSGGLSEVDPEDVITDWQSGSGQYWLDVEDYQTEELEPLLDRLGLSPFLKRHCLDGGQKTHFLPLPTATFLETTVFADWECSQPTSLAFLSLDRLLVSLHQTPIESLNRVRSLVVDDFELGTHGTSGTLCRCLSMHAESTTDAVRNISKTVQQVDKRMDQDPGSVELDEILDLKDALRTLDEVVNEQSAGVELMISVSDSPTLDLDETRGRLSLVAATTRHADRSIVRLEKQVAELRQRYEIHQQDKTNHRLAILTVLSAIFLPLTLMAGIWGMNFDSMPELHVAHGYPVALCVMAAISADPGLVVSQKRLVRLTRTSLFVFRIDADSRLLSPSFRGHGAALPISVASRPQSGLRGQNLVAFAGQTIRTETVRNGRKQLGVNDLRHTLHIRRLNGTPPALVMSQQDTTQRKNNAACPVDIHSQ